VYKRQAETIARQVEAKRVAFADRNKYVTDPEFAPVPVDMMLSKEYAARRRAVIDTDSIPRAVRSGTPARGDTTTFMVVDKDRNCVSFINSLFSNMGCGVVVEGTGILLQSRAAGFRSDPDHFNKLEPHKRTMHTLNPLMVLKDGNPYIVMGVIGGDQQTQASQQIIANVVDFGMNMQEALDAPRWSSAGGITLCVEEEIGPDVRDALAAKGYRVVVGRAYFGGAQAIMLDPASGDLLGATDTRIGGAAIGY